MIADILQLISSIAKHLLVPGLSACSQFCRTWNSILNGAATLPFGKCVKE